MRSVWHLATNSLGGRPGRNALIVAAVAMATCLIVTVAAATGTLSASVQRMLGQNAGSVDLRLSHRFGGKLDQSLVRTVSDWSQVREAGGSFETPMSIRSASSGKSGVLVARGVDLSLLPRLKPPKLVTGRQPTSANELVIDQPQADELGVKVDDYVELAVASEREAGSLSGVADMMLGLGQPEKAKVVAPAAARLLMRMKVVGLVERPRLRVLQRPMAIMSLSLVQRMAGAPGAVDAIDIFLQDGIEPDEVIALHGKQLPADTALREPPSAASGARRAMFAMRVAMGLITALVFFAAGFIIVTSLTTAVTERQRELAVLRCIGASRAQVAGAQLLGGVMLAAIGAVIAAPIGLALAYAMYARHRDALQAGFAPSWWGVVMAMAAAIATGAAGALYPAIRAASVQPLSALAVSARQPRRGGVLLCLGLGLVLNVAQPLVMASPMSDRAATWTYACAGMPMLLAGFFLLCIPVLRMCVLIIGWPVARLLRVPNDLLRESVVATPYRHGLTAGAMMIGLAMLVSIWTTTRSAMSDWLGDLKMPDMFVARLGVAGLIPLSGEEWDALRKIDGVTAACPVAAFPVSAPKAKLGAPDLGDTMTLFVSLDPEAFFEMTSLTWVQGDADSARARLAKGGAVLVSREFLTAHGLGLGKFVTLDTLRGPVDFEVAGVIASPGLDMAVHHFGIQRYYSAASLSSVFGSREDARKHFGNDQRNLILLRLASNADDGVITPQVGKAAPGAIAISARQIRRNIEEGTAKLTAVASMIAIAALLIGTVGVANLIAANIATRRHEMGVLRAVGASRWMAARLLIGETVIVAATACVAGACLGVELAAIGRLFHARLLGLSYGLHVPWDVIAYGALFAATACVAAALPGAWRVGRASPRAMLGG